MGNSVWEALCGRDSWRLSRLSWVKNRAAQGVAFLEGPSQMSWLAELTVPDEGSTAILVGCRRNITSGRFDLFNNC